MGSFWGNIFAALITGCFGVGIMLQNRKTNRNLKPSNGTTLATTVEKISAKQDVIALKLDAHAERLDRLEKKAGVTYGS